MEFSKKRLAKIPIKMSRQGLDPEAAIDQRLERYAQQRKA